MIHADPPPDFPIFDELARLLLHVARRADEMSLRSGGEAGGRDYWREAEAEVLAAGGLAVAAPEA